MLVLQGSGTLLGKGHELRTRSTKHARKLTLYIEIGSG